MTVLTVLTVMSIAVPLTQATFKNRRTGSKSNESQYSTIDTQLSRLPNFTIALYLTFFIVF